MSVPIISATGNLGDIVPADTSDDDPWLIEIAQDGSEQHYSYGDLRSQSNTVARGLLSRGLKRGERVAIVAENSARYLVAYFGIMRAGLCAVPVNIKLTKDNIAHILNDSEVRLVLTDRAHTAKIPEGDAVLAIDGSDWEQLADPGPFEPVSMQPEEFANIMYTSGSTGRPKGVPLTHGGFLFAVAISASGGDWKNERSLIAAPLYHMNGLYFSKMLAAGGGQEVLLCRFTGADYLKAIERHHCTVITSVPTMLALAMREQTLLASLDLSSVTTVLTGSSPSTGKLWADVRKAFPGATIANSYGTTESSPIAFAPHPDGKPTPDLAFGVQSPYAELELRDGSSPDEGTLWVRHKAIMPGYLNLPEKTADKVQDGWYNTGDVMRRDPDGFFYFVGRADDMFNCGGENIYPGEVEKMLERHPAIAQAAVVPVPDEIKGMLPAAFIVTTPGTNIDRDEVKRFALDNAPAYQHPRFVAFIDALPLSGTNKVDRSALTTRARSFSRDNEKK
ncbi:MAG: class I adenylate-forming enzyme family protein [Roseitalea porphyridii]|jgi:long-chain acyl-CoA synthetase|uniref:class I adenylate-forming enzyme family protein n=1 Tax=Roseitalea porphyridii TaxID=1852022 RepID=UPI0032EACDD8